VAQRAGIDLALEHHHVLHRVPEVDPAPVVELGLVGRVQAQIRLGAGELQQEPHLLLADADDPVLATHRPVRQPVTQPAGRDPEHGHVLGREAGLLAELAVHGFQRRLVGVHPALRELPAVAAHAPGPEHPAIRVPEHAAHVGAITVRIDHDADSRLHCFRLCHALAALTSGSRSRPGRIDWKPQAVENCGFAAPQWPARGRPTGRPRFSMAM
jgi:hypothetical protein